MKVDIDKLIETNFANVILGARVMYSGNLGQKIDENTVSGNKYGNDKNFLANKGSCNIEDDELCKTTKHSLKDRPELHHV